MGGSEGQIFGAAFSLGSCRSKPQRRGEVVEKKKSALKYLESIAQNLSWVSR
jgi:hypothetical protein